MSIVIGLVLGQTALAVPPPAPGARDWVDPDFHPGPHHCLRPPTRAARPSFIGSAISGNFPIKVHWDRASDEDKALQVLDWADLSWQVQVNELGHRPPELPDAKEGPQLDIYLSTQGVAEWAAVTYQEDYTDHVARDGYMSTPAHIVIHRDITEDWIGSYVVHEFNHALQWGTDFTEPTYPIWEAVATASTTWTYGPGERGQWYASVADFQEAPYAPSLTGYGGDLWGWYREGYYFEYGGAMWVRHIDEILGNNDGTTGARLWEFTAQQGWGYEPDVVDSVMTATDLELGEFMNSLALSRWLIGDEWDERGLADAKRWEDSKNRKVPAYEFTGDELPLNPRFDVRPMPTGQVFIDLTVDGLDAEAAGDKVSIWATSESGLHTSIAAFTWATDGTVGELGDWGSEPVVTVEGVSGLERIVIVMSNLGPRNFDPDDDKLYKLGDQDLFIEAGDAPKGVGGGDCDCQTGPGPAAGWMVLLAAAATRRRRR